MSWKLVASWLLWLLLQGMLFVWLITGIQIWSQVRLVQCDVGQGDAILLSVGYQQLLIDAGPDQAVLECLKKYMPLFDRHLEIVIATHADADHIGGFASVFRYYHARSILITPQSKPTDQSREFFTALTDQAQNGAKIIYAEAGQRLEIGSHSYGTILWPDLVHAVESDVFPLVTETELSALKEGKNEIKDDYNDGSIVVLLTIHNTKILLMGDAEEKTELALRDRGVLANIDVIKAGHHGSKSSSTAGFLQFLQPEVALIGVGKGNRYGHPDVSVLQRFAEQGVAVWRTDLHGSVELTITQEGYAVRPSRRDQNG